jgi:hypothetical protein
MRSKEDAHDYRYFPDPDLLPLVLDEAWVAELKAKLPELPDAKRQRFMHDYGLTAYDAGVLVAEQAAADFYETVAKGRDAKIAANWVTGDLFAALNRAGHTIVDSPVSAASLGKLLDLMADNTISGRIAKEVFEAMVETGKDPAAIVEDKGLRQVTDSSAIDAAVERVLAANADGGEPAPDFDVHLLGMGGEGHINSLFPHTAAIRETRRLVVGVPDSPKPPPQRITLTLPAVQRSREVWLVVSGAEKADAVAAAVGGADPDDVPAAGAKGRDATVWLLDEEAASKLQS